MYNDMAELTALQLYKHCTTWYGTRVVPVPKITPLSLWDTPRINLVNISFKNLRQMYNDDMAELTALQLYKHCTTLLRGTERGSFLFLKSPPF